MLLFAHWACTGNDKTSGDDDDTTPPVSHTGDPTHTGETVEVEPVNFTADPVLRDNPDAGLTAWVDATLSRDGWLELDVEIDGLSWTVQSEPSEVQSFLLLGLRPDADLVVTVTGHTEDGASTDPVVLTDRTDPLPADMYVRRVALSDPSRMEPGVTLLGENTYVVMVDADGVPCWYRSTVGARQTVDWYDGVVGIVGDRNRIDLLDLSGALTRRIYTDSFLGVPVPEAFRTDALALHHDMRVLPNGNLLALSIEARDVLYPVSESVLRVPEVSNVAGDVITELTPEGAIVAEWPLHDLLNPLRVAYDGVRGDYWEESSLFEGGDFTSDWTHTNSIDYDPATDTILLSLRHQDAIVSLSRATGTINWIAAPDVNWLPDDQALVLTPPADPDDQFYHQHHASFTPRGTVLLFDNGNRRASALEDPRPAEEVFSRAMEISIDEVTGTWQVEWQWGLDRASPEFAGSLGGVQELPQTGNHLVTFGNASSTPGVYARVYEVAPDDTVVWQLDLDSDDAWFRAVHLTGVIPGR